MHAEWLLKKFEASCSIPDVNRCMAKKEKVYYGF
jgi:hypothetical protein